MDKVARIIGEILRDRGCTVSVAESFTSGRVASTLASVPGASDYFIGGVVAYSKDIKRDVLGVDSKTMDRNGVVHHTTAIEMAQGVSKVMSSDYGLSTTGLAGPGGGTPETPVGTVCFAIFGPGFINSYTATIEGDRNEVVCSSVELILEKFKNTLANSIE